jgi:hypothetical protein
MTATLDVVTKKKQGPEPSPEQRAAEELVRRPREQGLSLTGPDGLLKQLTKTVGGGGCAAADQVMQCVAQDPCSLDWAAGASQHGELTTDGEGGVTWRLMSL